MKLIAAPLAVLIASLLALPALMATGDAQLIGCTGTAQLDAVLATIRTLESGGDYTARASGSSASGAYQFIDTTWAGYGGYPQAWQAPPAVQDAKANEHVSGILDAHDGDVTVVSVVWYLGYLPAPGSETWDTVPSPGAGNRLTPREYQARWLTEYDRQLALARPGAGAGGGCLPGGSIGALADGYAYPGPPELFATAPVDSPHHDYPAWDWPIPSGTPIYAVRGGRAAAVQYWPYNWWDYGCGTNAAGCSTCGIGVTIEDDTGLRWTYCHGDAVHVQVGDTIAAGTQILTSGDTGRSSGPHLHLQIRTPDGALRCPQPLLRSIRDQGAGLDPTSLPVFGCFY
ncbi:MAG: peptidoglycan DD-metalloendopeptidase family protein [Natronosporangium sp.]